MKLGWIKIAGIAGAALALWWLVAKVKDTLGQAAQGRAYAACAAAADTPADALTACPSSIRQQIEAARQAAECSRALDSADAYAIRMACPTAVKTIEAKLTAAANELANAQAQLTKARAETTEAVARAEARAVLLADRKANDDATINKAPDLGDGRVRCDAECLRSLAQGGAGTRR